MAYGFNDDRSKAPMYTKAEIDAMDLVNDQALAQEVSDRQAGDDFLDARIDTILASQDLDPNKDSELVDIRTGYDGTVHASAGDAVRRIDANVCAVSKFYDTNGGHFIRYEDTTWETGWLNHSTGSIVSHNDYKTSDYIDCIPGEYISFRAIGIYADISAIGFYDINKNAIDYIYSESTSPSTPPIEYTGSIPDDAYFIRFCTNSIRDPETEIVFPRIGMNSGLGTWWLELSKTPSSIASSSVNDEQEYIENDLVDASDLFTLHEGYYLNKDALVAITGNYVGSELVDLDTANGIVVSGAAIYSTKALCVFDLNKNFLYQIPESNQPSETSFSINVDKDAIVSEYPTAYYIAVGSYGPISILKHPTKTYQEKVSEIDGIIKPNYIVPGVWEQADYTITDGAYVRSTGNIIASQDYAYSEFIDIDTFTEIKANIAGGWDAVGYVITTANKSVLYYYLPSSPFEEQVHLVSEEIKETYPTARYIRFGGYKQSIRKGLYLMVQPKTLDNFPSILMSHTNNVLFNKKIAFCGDSFVEASNLGDDGWDKDTLCYKSFGQRIAKRNSMKLYHDGISGSTMHIVDVDSPSTRNPFAYQRYMNVPSDCDYIILQFGLNESSIANDPATLGTRDSLDKTTMWGSWNTVLGYLIENNPTAHIGVIMPDAWMVQSYFDALSDICEWWGIPMLDLGGGDPNIPIMNGGRRPNCGLSLNPAVASIRNETFYTSYPSDSHPNDAGHEWRSTVVENWIRSL